MRCVIGGRWVISLAGLAATFGVASSAAAQRQPYLQLGTETSMTVVWETNGNEPTAVCYGTSPDALTNRAGSGSGTDHVVRVDGLSPGNRYFYAVGSASCPPPAPGSPNRYFRTAPLRGASTPFRFWVVGDSGTGGSAQRDVRDAMLAAAGSTPPDLYLQMGDMAYSDGTAAEFTSNFFGIYENILQNTVCWPTIGNHEGHTSTSSTESGPYYDAYVLPRNGEAGGLASGTEAYYAFDYGNAHFIILDSHGSGRNVGDPMLDWLEMDLAATDQQWVVAYWHHPPYTKGSHDSDREGSLIDMRENASRLLEQGGADLILGGHSHIYERSFLVHGAYDTPTTAAGHIINAGDGRLDGDGAYRTSGDGTVYIVAGHGGTGVGGSGDHPLMYFSETENGSVLADVAGPTMTLRNIRRDGQETDHLTLIKGEGLFLSAPRGGDMVIAGSTTDIAWASTGTTTAVRLEYSLDGGGAWTTIVDRTDNDGMHPWITPPMASAAAMVRITDADDPGVTHTTEPFSLVRNATADIIEFGALWEYLDDGTDPGTEWQTNYGGWDTGNAEFGYGDGDETTVLRDESPKIPSVHFRHRVEITERVTAARLRIRVDDGAIVWVNGVNVYSYNADDPAYDAYATGSSMDNEVRMQEIDLGTTNPFTIGQNIVAVTVKQADATSSDLSFDFALTVDTEVVVPPPSDGGVLPGSDGGAVGDDAGGASRDTGPASGLDGGCSCGTGGRSRSPLGSLVLFALTLGWIRRRR